MKSSAPLAVTGVLGCILMRAAFKLAKRMYLVHLLRVIESAHLNFRRAEALRRFAARQLPPSFFRGRKFRLCSAVVSFRRNTARAHSRLSWSVTVSGKSDFVGTHE